MIPAVGRTGAFIWAVLHWKAVTAISVTEKSNGEQIQTKECRFIYICNISYITRKFWIAVTKHFTLAVYEEYV
jgi:hypothetical protein